MIVLVLSDARENNEKRTFERQFHQELIFDFLNPGVHAPSPFPLENKAKTKVAHLGHGYPKCEQKLIQDLLYEL